MDPITTPEYDGLAARARHRRRQCVGSPPGPAHNARMPIPEPERHDVAEDEEGRPRRVAGTVRLMTEDLFEIDEDAETGLGQRLSTIATQKPWIIPAALLGIGVAFLVLRRRR
jgi:hypothetical protein